MLVVVDTVPHGLPPSTVLKCPFSSWGQMFGAADLERAKAKRKSSAVPWCWLLFGVGAFCFQWVEHWHNYINYPFIVPGGAPCSTDISNYYTPLPPAWAKATAEGPSSWSCDLGRMLPSIILWTMAWWAMGCCLGWGWQSLKSMGYAVG